MKPSDLLRQAWHSPRSGPVILVLLGTPALALAIIVAAYPLLLAFDVARLALGISDLALLNQPRWFNATMSAIWLMLILLVVRLRATALANRGLDLSVPLRHRGRPIAASMLAERLGSALAAAGATVGEVVREDYGFGLWVEADGERLWLSISADGGRDRVVGLSYDPGFDLKRRLSHRVDRRVFARLAATLETAIDADPGLVRV